jgi:hypothetical protein
MLRFVGWKKPRKPIDFPSSVSKVHAEGGSKTRTEVKLVEERDVELKSETESELKPTFREGTEERERLAKRVRLFQL